MNLAPTPEQIEDNNKLREQIYRKQKEMSEAEETVTITKKEYDNLKKDSDWLLCLKSAGVDNWQGIDCAYELQREAE